MRLTSVLTLVHSSTDDKIVVFWTKEVTLPHFNRYRVRFREVYSGRLDEFYQRPDSPKGL